MNKKQRSIIVFLFFLVFFIGFHLSRPAEYVRGQQTSFLGFETINSDTINYLERIHAEGANIVDLKTPFQYFLTKFALNFLSIKTILWLFPFLTFFGSLAILLLIFEQLKLEPFLIPILLSWNVFWVPYYLNFGRDNWMLLFFSIMLYSMIKINYFFREKYWVLLVVVSLLAVLTKLIGIIFVGITISFAVYRFAAIKKDFNFLVALPIGNVLNDYLAGLRSTEVSTLTSLSAIFITPLHGVAFFVALHLKDTFNYLLIFWIIFSGHILYNFGHDGGTIYRYLFIFMPASVLIFAMFYKKMSSSNGFFSKRNALLLCLTAFFYMNNLARIAAQIGLKF